jgi:parallel beta-helix repeat protein
VSGSLALETATPDPNTSLHVVGVGFTADALMRVFCTGQDPAAGQFHNAGGLFTISVITPAVSGAAQVIAQEFSGGLWVTVASEPITVSGNAPPPPPPPPPAVVPDAPTHLAGVTGSGQVALSWSAPAQNGGSAVTGYVVYKNGVSVATPTGTSQTVTSLTNGTAYSFQVAAVNAVGEGPKSAAITVTPQASQVGTPPDASAGALQALIDAAAAGSIVVAPWKTYKESITINKALTLDLNKSVVDGQSTRTTWATITASDVTIRNGTMKDAKAITSSADFQKASIVCTGARNRLTLEKLHLIKPTACHLTLQGGTGHRLVDIEAEQAPTAFMTSGSCADLKIYGTGDSNWPARIHDNRTSSLVDPLNEGGGFKFSNANGVEVYGLEVDHNAGPGIWADINCRNVNVHDNKVHHNTHAGIFFEISATGTIAYNDVWEIGWDTTVAGATKTHDGRGDDFGWPSGILASSSKAVELHHNTIAWCRTGLGIIYQGNRADRQQPEQNVWPHDNFVAGESGKKLETWNQDGSGGTLFSDASNRGQNDRFYSAGGDVTNFVYSGGKTLSAFNGTRGGSGSASYVSSGTKDTLLAAAGIPTSPESH